MTMTFCLFKYMFSRLDSPALKLNQGIYCNSTKETVLSCEVSGELYKYGFAEWVHRFNGQGIRKLNGTVVGNLSFLLLQSCGYQDVGHYICRAWNDYNGQIFWATRKTTVKVFGIYRIKWFVNEII